MRKSIITVLLCLVAFSANAEWRYGSEKDVMTDEKISYAWIGSDNAEKVGATFKASQKMYLSMKKIPSKGMDIGLVFSLDGASDDPVYYMCRFRVDSPCSVMVRFDSNPVEELIITPPPTGGDDVMFFANPDLVYEKLKNAKVVLIRASIYNAGEVTFKFDTEGFKGLQ